MPEEQLTISGKVASVTFWKSGKGSWVELEDNPNDFFAYKGKVPKVGETNTWKVAKGKGYLAEKVELVGPLKEPSLKEKIAVKAKEEVKDMEEQIAKGDKVYFDKQELIVKQCCIKAAATVLAGERYKGGPVTLKDIAESVVDMADRFYCYICRGEGPEPEEPEAV